MTHLRRRRKHHRILFVKEPRLQGEALRRRIRGLASLPLYLATHDPRISHRNVRAADFLYRYIERWAVIAEHFEPGSTEQAEAMVRILLAVQKTPLSLVSVELCELAARFPIRAAAAFANHGTRWYPQRSADLALMGMANALCAGAIDHLQKETLTDPLIQRGLALWREPTDFIQYRAPVLVTYYFNCHR